MGNISINSLGALVVVCLIAYFFFGGMTTAGLVAVGWAVGSFVK